MTRLTYADCRNCQNYELHGRSPDPKWWEEFCRATPVPGEYVTYEYTRKAINGPTCQHEPIEP